MTAATFPANLNWDLTAYFPTFDGPEYRAFRDKLKADIIQLREDAARLGSITRDNLAAWTELLVRAERVSTEASHIGSYVGCLCAADSRNEDYKREDAALAVVDSEGSKSWVQIAAAFREVSDDLFDALLSHPDLSSARYHFERLRKEARLNMDTPLEMLAADLAVDGFHAWGRLYDNIGGALEFDLKLPDGTSRRVPMAQKRGLLDSPDPAVRKATLVGSNAAWESVGETVAACLNHISGTRLTLYKRRGIEHFLDPATFDSGITRKTLDTIFETIARLRPIPHRIWKLKASLLGRERLGFQDLGAPLPLTADASIDWERGRQLVLDSARAFDPGFAEFVEMSYRKDWIESEKRPGKRPGAFCTSSYRIRESRVFMTYNGTLSDVQTLAHELGHAYHNWVMRDLRPYCRHYPMTLAETASTFAEDVLTGSILKDPATSDAVKAMILNNQLAHAAIFLTDIPMRFLFERALYEERGQGELPVSRLKALMLEKQREAFGDTLDPAEMDDMFWASKLHFYITGVSFYNFPYTFGYLFSRGIMARARREGPSFLPKYISLLRLTGSHTAEGVALKSLGVDLEKPEFWEEAIRSLEPEIAEFETVARKVLAGK